MNMRMQNFNPGFSVITYRPMMENISNKIIAEKIFNKNKKSDREKPVSIVRCPFQPYVAHSVEKVLSDYNEHTKEINGEYFYTQEQLDNIKTAIQERGFNSVFKVLGNGVESIAVQVPSKSKDTEVLKISCNPVQNYILDIFNEKSSTGINDIIEDDELKKYVVPMCGYQIHDINGQKLYSYFQDELFSKGYTNGKEQTIVSDNLCKKFSQQLHDETAYVIDQGENMPKQYGFVMYPNGRIEMRILDYGIIKSKLDDEADEYYCIEDALRDAKAAKEKRIKEGRPDIRIFQDISSAVHAK